VTVTAATDPTCTDHWCDRCDLCRSGVCCGSEVATMDLPPEGSWDGPLFGEIGVLNESLHDGVQCHCCGKWYDFLGKHIGAHGLDSDTYRAMFGLNATQALTCQRIRDERAARAVGRSDIARHSPTPEQKSVIGSRRYARSQSAREGQPLFTAEHQSAASKARWAKPHARAVAVWVRRQSLDHTEGTTCPVCGVAYCRVPNTKNVTYCGARECLSEIKRRAAKARHAKGTS
jgi:hypothetical protein